MSGCPDDSDRPRREEGASRGDRGDSIALLKTRYPLRGQGGWQLDLDRVRRRAHIHRKPARPKHADHSIVVRQHLRQESGNPVTVGDLGQVCKKDCRYAALLPCVSDHERDLGLMLIHTHIHGMGNHHGRIPGDRHEAEPVRVVHVERPLGRPLEVRIAKEPKSDRVSGQPLKKRPHRLAILHANGTHVNRRTIAQGNVRLPVARIPHLARRRLIHDHPLSIASSETTSAVATDSQQGRVEEAVGLARLRAGLSRTPSSHARTETPRPQRAA